MGRLADSAREARKEIEALHGAITRTDRAVQDLDGNELRVALPVVVPDGPGGGGGRGGGAAPPPAPGVPSVRPIGLGSPGAGVTYSSSTKGGGKGQTGDETGLVWVRAIDGPLEVLLRDLQRFGEAIDISWFGSIRAGFRYQGYHFLDPGAGSGSLKRGGKGGGGSINPSGPLVYSPRTTSGPDGGADTGKRRQRGGSTVDPAAAATDRMRRELGGKLDRLSSQLQGGGMADAIRRAR